MPDKIDYEALRLHGEKAAYVLLSISLAVYIWQYHLAKSLLVIQAVIAIFLILPRTREYFSNLSRFDVAWLFILVLYPCGYYLGFLVHDRPLDLFRGNDVAINSIVGLSLYLVIRNTRHFTLDAFCRYAAVSMAIAGTIVVWQWAANGFQGRWTIGTNLTLVFACVASAASMMCFWRLIHDNDKPWAKLFYLYAGLIGIASIVAAGARGAIFAIMVLISIYVFYGFLKKKVAPLLIVILIGSITFFWVFKGGVENLRIKQTISEIETIVESGEVNEHSLNLRIQMWGAAIEVIKKRAILGVGSGELVETFAGENVEISDIGLFTHVHNDILQAWSALGLPGLLSVLCLIVIPLWAGLSIKSPVTPYLIIIAVIFGVNSLTNAPFLRTYSLKYYFLVVGLLLIMHQRYGEKSA